MKYSWDDDDDLNSTMGMPAATLPPPSFTQTLQTHTASRGANDNTRGEDPFEPIQNPAAPPATAPPAAAPPPPPAPPKPLQWFTGPTQNAFAADNFWNPNVKSVRYEFARIASRYPTTPSGLKALVNDPEFKQKFPNAKLAGHDKIDFGGALSDGATGSPVGVIDVGEQFDDAKDTGRGWWWGHGGESLSGGGGSRGGSGAAGLDRSARDLTRRLSMDGHQVKADGLNRLIIDGRPYRVADAPTNPAWTPSFAPGTKPYTPGEIPMSDLEGYSFEQMMEKLRTPQDGMLDSLVGGVLANPESLSPLMVDTLKAQSADELAEIATAQQADLERFGWLTGNEDSNWLKSEQLASRRERDRALIGSNRDIDIKAAETNMADRLRAAELGTSYTAEKRARGALAADTSLRAAAAKQDRLALREAVAQKAAELQLDADQLMQQYVVSQMEDLTRRYGIQVAADVDIARLSLQSQQFKEDLAFKLAELQERMALGYAELDQDDAQFGAKLSLDVEKDIRDREEKAKKGKP